MSKMMYNIVMRDWFYLFLVCITIGLLSPFFALAQDNVISRDAIGLRVVPNPEHYSPLQWYNVNIKIKGSPQSAIIDGYEAVRDGRTVYVNSAKVVKVKRCTGSESIICLTNRDCPGGVSALPKNSLSFLERFTKTVWADGVCIASPLPELYTNIYIISYNQEPEPSTTDIFGQLLQFWKFNSDIKNCANDFTKLCSEDDECEPLLTDLGIGLDGICQSTAVCSQTNTKACLLDSDCPSSEYCLNKKSAIIRDVRRLADLRTTKDRLEKFNLTQGTYPSLPRGSYLTNRTVSTWPSWQTTFKTAMAGELPIDPLNMLGPCLAVSTPGYDPVTCWNEVAKEYSGGSNPLTLPNNLGKPSYAYYYQYKSDENTYRFCGITESGFIQAKAIGSPLCQVNNCATCTGRQCGTDGCGHSCGTCLGTDVCYRHKCVRAGSPPIDLD